MKSFTTWPELNEAEKLKKMKELSEPDQSSKIRNLQNLIKSQPTLLRKQRDCIIGCIQGEFEYLKDNFDSSENSLNEEKIKNYLL